MNSFGRTEGYSITTALVAGDPVMKAVCRDIEPYAAAQTIYWLGHTGSG